LTARASSGTNSTRVSLEGGRPRPPLDGVAEILEDPEEKEEEGSRTNETERTPESIPAKITEEPPINLGSGSALGFVNSQTTLTEQNADLLSFIAKKERKCLDLREGANSPSLLDSTVSRKIDDALIRFHQN
jgi:hypothetical protein